ncbi:MAG: hypothetical protein QOI26_1554, partial [Pseudonocardiales bacterium]|nr:hypothetical protein [Pseudonocardiales bacterium]
MKVTPEPFQLMYCHKSARSRLRAGCAAAIAASLVLTVAGQLPAAAAARYQPAHRTPVSSIAVTAVKPVRVPTAPSLKQAAAQPIPVWPAAGTADVDLTEAVKVSNAAPAGKAAAPAVPAPNARPGNLPVTLRPVRTQATASSQAGNAAPRRIRVEVYGRAATQRAGVRGVLMGLRRTDGLTAAGRIDLTVDYTAFRTAYGADWATRLRLVTFPDCALTTPFAAGCTGTALPTRNDAQNRTVSAQLNAGSAATLVALSAAPSGAAGSYAATSLAASSTWSSGGNSGNFAWSYPMGVPPSLGGPAPAIGLSYSSQSVDGRHAATNNQPSWAGEGFDAWPGYIERRYRSCSDDMSSGANNSKKTGDECWATDNATMSLSGHSGELIYNKTEKVWHLRDDDGTKAERRIGAVNGDDDGEYWVITTTEGMQYWFGLNKLPGAGSQRTESTWTVPVFGNHADEPCHADAFKDSSCKQAYRWNLD